MYKKVLFNIKKMKKCGGGGGAKPKSKKKKRKSDNAGIRTHDLRVRNPLG